LPDACTKMFQDTSTPISISNAEYFHPENIEVQNFFKAYSIKAFIGGPLIRYNHETKLLGVLFICSNIPRDWSEYEVSLLKAINESVANTIWEILKTIEVNRLRDTFVTTLAHDLQVPIVGDITALEFMASRTGNETIESFKEIIDEALRNDRRILTILKSLLESYQYEAGKKQLKLAQTQLATIINNAIDIRKDFANSKSISIETHIPDNLPEITIDKEEIDKVISILLDNAITYTQNGGYIIINLEYKDNSITTCITDNGPGIPANIRKLVFKRYEMAIEIGRKIGAGISLYLAKQIIDAHKGKIWYKTELGKGTTFCFLLTVG
jgi:signal transduction histidine kinase